VVDARLGEDLAAKPVEGLPGLGPLALELGSQILGGAAKLGDALPVPGAVLGGREGERGARAQDDGGAGGGQRDDMRS
jgi:hypothetical protein